MTEAHITLNMTPSDVETLLYILDSWKSTGEESDNYFHLSHARELALYNDVALSLRHVTGFRS